MLPFEGVRVARYQFEIVPYHVGHRSTLPKAVGGSVNWLPCANLAHALCAVLTSIGNSVTIARRGKDLRQRELGRLGVLPLPLRAGERAIQFNFPVRWGRSSIG